MKKTMFTLLGDELCINLYRFKINDYNNYNLFK